VDGKQYISLCYTVPSEPRELKKKEGEKSSEVTFSWLEPSYTAGPLNKFNIKFDYPNDPHVIANIIGKPNG